MREFINKRNPVLPVDIHVPDCEARVMPDGNLYIYGSYDNREDVYCSEEYHVVSTEDMEHWKIYGASLKGTDIPWFNNPDTPKYPGIDWSNPTPFIRKMLEDTERTDEKKKFEQQDEGEKPALLFAPDAIHKDGKYYLYFCMSDDSEGVAVSDSPTGPFVNPIQLPCGGIDPSVFIDDDGQAYYYWGQLFSHGVRLNSDMVSFDRNDIIGNLVTEEEHCFHEGSCIRKIKDTYYYIYSDMERGKPTSLGYSTGKSPLGPFTYRGIIIDNADCDPESWNNHGSIECVNGQWYVFYHRASRGGQLHRRLCIEPITIREDGSIEEVKMTSQGIGEPFDTGEKIMGYQACGLSGTVYIDADKEYGEKLTNISDEDSAVFRYVKSGNKFRRVTVHAVGSGDIEIMMDGKSAGIVKIKDGIQITDRIEMGAGEYEVRLVFHDVSELEILEIWFHN